MLAFLTGKKESTEKDSIIAKKPHESKSANYGSQSAAEVAAVDKIKKPGASNFVGAFGDSFSTVARSVTGDKNPYKDFGK